MAFLSRVKEEFSAVGKNLRSATGPVQPRRRMKKKMRGMKKGQLVIEQNGQRIIIEQSRGVSKRIKKKKVVKTNLSSGLFSRGVFS